MQKQQFLLFSDLPFSRLPHPVQVTVFTGRNLIGSDGEKSLGGIAGVQKLTITGVTHYQLNPFDIMFFIHGMSDAADRHLVSTINLGNHRDMFFLGGINGVFSLKNHWRAATREISAATMQDFNNMSADITLIDTQFLSHNRISLKRFSLRRGGEKAPHRHAPHLQGRYEQKQTIS
jgi:hypothetical protein